MLVVAVVQVQVALKVQVVLEAVVLVRMVLQLMEQLILAEEAEDQVATQVEAAMVVQE
tara:strand:+ start:709 stop:882 length:174 start_codon:yes stop_codon:yes gene_type:complete